MPKLLRELWPLLAAATHCCLAPCLTRAACAPSSVSVPVPRPPPLAAQDYVQLDAAVVVGDTVYVGEFKSVLGEAAVGDVGSKLVKIRWGRRAACRPAGGYVQAIARSRGLPRTQGMKRSPPPCRGAVQRGRSPDLAAALQGVAHVKLFLCGEAVRPGLAVQELAEQAALVGASLVLPSGQAWLSSEPAPAVRL